MHTFQIYSQFHSDVVALAVHGTHSGKKVILAYLPMYPFHASPSLPGPHSSMDSAKGKSHWACSPHCSRFLSLPGSSVLSPTNLFPRQPAPLWPQRDQHWSLYCLVTWPARVQAPGVTAWLVVQWQPGVIWVEMIVLFSLAFNNAAPALSSQPSHPN